MLAWDPADLLADLTVGGPVFRPPPPRHGRAEMQLRRSVLAAVGNTVVVAVGLLPVVVEALLLLAVAPLWLGAQPRRTPRGGGAGGNAATCSSAPAPAPACADGGTGGAGRNEPARAGVRPVMDDTLRLRFGMAELLFEQRRYREAAELLEVVVAEVPENASARILLARSFFHAAMLTRAEEEARRIVERWPVDAYAHLILARSLQRQSRHEEAVPHLRLAAALTGEEDLAP